MMSWRHFPDWLSCWFLVAFPVHVVDDNAHDVVDGPAHLDGLAVLSQSLMHCLLHWRHLADAGLHFNKNTQRWDMQIRNPCKHSLCLQRCTLATSTTAAVGHGIDDIGRVLPDPLDDLALDDVFGFGHGMPLIFL